MLNKIIIMGRLTKDVELRRTNSGTAVSSFTVAVDRDFGEQKEADFIECVAWKGTAEFVERHFSKGKMIVVSGRLQIRGWDDKNGNKRQSAEIVVENVYFGESKSSDARGNRYEKAMQESREDYPLLDDDTEGLPF